MINLMPTQSKENFRYARRNAQLLRWVAAIVVATAGCLIILAFGYIYLNQTTKTYQKRISEGEAQLKIQKLEETQARVNEISGNLKLVVQVLSRNILFSKVLKQVGAAIPSGAVLTDLTINKVQGGIDLTFEARDYQTSSQIVLNLQDPENKVFEKADIEEISCDSELQSNRTYLCQVSVRALFGDNSPYLFINDGVQR